MSVSFPKIRMAVAMSAMGVFLAGCASGGLSLPSIGGSQSPKPPANGVQSSASDVANAGSIIDDTTRAILSNPKKISGYCPQVSILGDTNVYQKLAARGVGTADQNLVLQATITQTARECTTLGAEMFIKVGVAGRVLGGPKSTTQTKGNLPLRIVVRQLDKVLYSRLHKVPVSLNTPDRSALFAKVDETIAIATPSEKNVQILVGFDATAK